MKVQTFSQQHSCNWQWPITMGVIDKSDSYIEDLKTGHWTNTFVKIRNLSGEKTHVNILFADNGLLELAKVITSNKTTCDVVIIKMKDDYFSNNRNETEEANIMQGIVNKTNAGAVFMITFSNDTTTWLHQLIVQLSHNEGIRASLNHCVTDGYGLYDPKFDQTTTLRFLIEELCQNLDMMSKFGHRKIKIQTVLHGLQNIREISPIDLKKYLNKESPHFKFEHESGEAEGLLQLMNSLDEDINADIIEKPFPGSPIETLIDSDDEPKMSEPPEEILDKEIDRGFSGAEPEAPTSEPSPDSDEKEKGDEFGQRYLQAVIKDQANQSMDFLEPNFMYKLKVRIGAFDQEWKQSLSPFPDEQIFTKPDQQEEIIQIHFKSNLSETQSSGNLILKRNGNTNEAEFLIQTNDSVKVFKGEIYAYFKNRLIQKASILSTILQKNQDRKKVPPTQMQIDFTFKTDLSDLENSTTFGSSIYLDTSQPNQESITGISNNKAINLRYTTALNTLVNTIKDRIQSAIINIEDHPEDLEDPENVKLLLRLALDGNSLYVNYLKEKNNIEGPMQIISHTSEFIPMDFVYTYAAPDGKSILCPKAKQCLKDGQCCHAEGVQKAPAKYICPFGFWGFSHVIERHSAERFKDEHTGDYTIIPGPGRKLDTLKILDHGLYAVSDKVNADNKNVKKELTKSLAKNIHEINEASNWEEWSKIIEEKKPDSIIMLVHIETDPITDHEQIEIGNKQFLIQNQFDINQFVKDKKQHPPFVVMIGCEATNIANYGFDISSQLMNKGAAIVISNFTKIRGRHAGPIVIQLLDFLKENAGTEITLGEIMLKLRQNLLSKGIMVSLALIAFGDADWKIKT